MKLSHFYYWHWGQQSSGKKSGTLYMSIDYRSSTSEDKGGIKSTATTSSGFSTSGGPGEIRTKNSLIDGSSRSLATRYESFLNLMIIMPK